MAASFETFVIGLLGVIVGALVKFAFDKTLKRQDRREEWFADVERRLNSLERYEGIGKIDARLQIIEYKVGIIFRGIEEHVVKIVLPERER